MNEELNIESKQEKISEVKLGNRTISDPIELAESFAEHFKTCATTFVNSLPSGATDYSKIDQGVAWDFNQTNVVEVAKIILGLQTKNSCGKSLRFCTG